MLMIILKVIYFGLPAIIANALPVFLAKYNLLEILNKPIDNNLKFFNQPLFGRTKTWRGFLIGVLGGLIIIYFQQYLDRNIIFLKQFALINYQSNNLWLIGFLLGFGALSGDLIKSFIKRRFGIASGKCWWPWDNFDSTWGALFFLCLYVRLENIIIITALFIGPIIHMVFNFVGYNIKYKKSW